MKIIEKNKSKQDLEKINIDSDCSISVFKDKAFIDKSLVSINKLVVMIKGEVAASVVLYPSQDILNDISKLKKSSDLIEYIDNINSPLLKKINPKFRSFKLNTVKSGTRAQTGQRVNGYPKRESVDYGNNEIPIFMLIHLLAEDGLIEIFETQRNGIETKYKFQIADSVSTKKTKKYFNVSTVGEDNYALDPEKASYYVDFMGNFEKEKGSAGAFNFIKDLERLGLFGEPLSQESGEDIKELYRTVGKKVNEYKNRVPKSFEYKATPKNGFGRISQPSVMPTRLSPSTKLKPALELRRVLKDVRGLDDKIIDDAINSGLMSFAKYYTKAGKQSVGVVFHMKGAFDVYPISDEVGFLLGEKIKKMFSSRQRSVRDEKNIFTGRGYALSIDRSKLTKPKGTIFSEAVIDSLSLKNLMELSGRNPSEYNHLSVQALNASLNYFKDTFGFYFKKSDDPRGNYKVGDIFEYSIQENLVEVEDDVKEKFKLFFESKKINFALDKSRKGSSFQLEKLNYFLKYIGLDEKSVNVIGLSYSGEKIEDGSVFSEDSILFDSSNIDKFLEENNIFSKYIKSRNAYEYKLIEKTVVDRPIELTNEVIKDYHNRVTSILGSDKIIVAFDNDQAGLSYYEGFYKMCEKIGLDCHMMIPPYHVYKHQGNDYFINDINDVLRFYRQYENDKRFKDGALMDWINEKFLSQLESKMDLSELKVPLMIAEQINAIKSENIDNEERKSVIIFEYLREVLKKNPPEVFDGLGRSGKM